MQKKILVGITIIVAAVILFGGVFAYQYFASKEFKDLRGVQKLSCISEGGKYASASPTMMSDEVCCEGLILVQNPVGAGGICIKDY